MANDGSEQLTKQDRLHRGVTDALDVVVAEALLQAVNENAHGEHTHHMPGIAFFDPIEDVLHKMQAAHKGGCRDADNGSQQSIET